MSTKAQYLTTTYPVASAEWRKRNPNNCPVMLRDGEGKGGLGMCMHYMNAGVGKKESDGVCPTHGKVYDLVKPLRMTPALALACLWKPKQTENLFKDKVGAFLFDNDHAYQVYKARKQRGWPVDAHNVDVTALHPMKGKRLLLNDGKEVTVKSLHEHWHWGSYITMVTEDDQGSSVVLMWEDISLFSDWMKERVRECRARVTAILG
jgi:hypothetical protein